MLRLAICSTVAFFAVRGLALQDKNHLYTPSGYSWNIDGRLKIQRSGYYSVFRSHFAPSDDDEVVLRNQLDKPYPALIELSSHGNAKITNLPASAYDTEQIDSIKNAGADYRPTLLIRNLDEDNSSLIEIAIPLALVCLAAVIILCSIFYTMYVCSLPRLKNRTGHAATADSNDIIDEEMCIALSCRVQPDVSLSIDDVSGRLSPLTCIFDDGIEMVLDRSIALGEMGSADEANVQIVNNEAAGDNNDTVDLIVDSSGEAYFSAASSMTEDSCSDSSFSESTTKISSKSSSQDLSITKRDDTGMQSSNDKIVIGINSSVCRTSRPHGNGVTEIDPVLQSTCRRLPEVTTVVDGDSVHIDTIHIDELDDPDVITAGQTSIDNPPLKTRVLIESGDGAVIATDSVDSGEPHCLLASDNVGPSEYGQVVAMHEKVPSTCVLLNVTGSCTDNVAIKRDPNLRSTQSSLSRIDLDVVCNDCLPCIAAVHDNDSFDEKSI